jgi:polyisoprenoid-binding protein YceI
MKGLLMKRILIAFAGTSFTIAAMAAPEVYVIDNNHTFPNFSYNHHGYSIQMSRFDTTSGKITIDREASSGSMDIEILTTSVNTGSKLFNEHIQDVDFLDTKQYPKATFKSTKMVFDGDKLSKVEGDLMLKGITKPVTLEVSNFFCKPHPMKKKDACGANASAVIKRSDFNMGKYVPAVSDEVTLNIAVEAIKE